MFKFDAVFLFLFLSAVGNAMSAEVAMVFSGTPEAVFAGFPHLANAKYQTKIWRGDLNFPVLGRKESVIRYFEFALPPEKIMAGASEIAVTLLKVLQDRKVLEITIITQANPTQFELANEAVNALLPLWLMGAGVDMYAVCNKRQGCQQQFTWDGRQWSFNQLSELLSDVVGAQVIPGGYMGLVAPSAICGKTTRPLANSGEDSYLLTRYLVRKTRCNLRRMYEESGEALKSFIKTAPKIK